LLRVLHGILQVKGYQKRVAAFSRMVKCTLVSTHSFGKPVTFNRPADGLENVAKIVKGKAVPMRKKKKVKTIPVSDCGGIECCKI
jgi:hypothetical protein